MRSILLHVREDRCLEAVRRAAFGLARGMGGHVTCLQAVPLDVGYGEFDMGLPAQIIPSLRENAEQLRKELTGRWAEDDTPREWVTEYAWAHTAIPRLAPLHDVVVMGACADDRGDSAYSPLAADLAITMRTPVLLVPESARSSASAPVPVLTGLVALALLRALSAERHSKPFWLSLLLFFLGMAGLGFTMWPYVVPPGLTIWDAAAPERSQVFMLVGVAVTLPLILGYTAWAYWVFRGKVGDEGYH